ncbi:dipeptidase [Rhizobium sp. AU243]|uniref:dipeptidase n=1 Tax=Rhizobium sp. AU243 TaxID=2303425 RepID=UPI0010CC4C61|nr:dipeptidase [Rhizobium sp. AU243]TKV70792.1 membrane dipeptidase [Rhizobium sp. AU243]
MNSLHTKLNVVDGLVVSNFNRDVFEDMQRGGLTAANCTCCIWEGFEQTVQNVSQWKKFLRENSDILLQVYDVNDIARAKASGRVGIILGWQNSSGYGDDLSNVYLFKELGVSIVQLTYNTANAVGSGCYETRDTGLTDFGRDLIDTMNAAGVLIDLSHVGKLTCVEAIAHSRQPVAYTHTLPAALRDHPRNKTDDQLRAIAEKGGFVGVTMFPAFLDEDKASTIETYIRAIEHVISVIGEEQLGIGTDITQGHSADFFKWINSDKGNGRKLVDFKNATALNGFETLDKFPSLTAAMDRRGWSTSRIERVMGENWIRLLGEVWKGYRLNKVAAE